MIPDCYGPSRLVQYWLFREKLPLECWSTLNMEMSLPDLTLGSYLLLFSLTLLLEFGIYWAILRRQRKLADIAVSSVCLNIATHPAVTFLFPVLAVRQQATTAVYITQAEIFAPLVEALLLYFVFSLPARTSLLASLTANLVSWGVGLAILRTMETGLWRIWL